MAGVVVFPSLAAAIHAGFEMYDRNAEGYLVRIRTAHGWAFAIARI